MDLVFVLKWVKNVLGFALYIPFPSLWFHYEQLLKNTDKELHSNTCKYSVGEPQNNEF